MPTITLYSKPHCPLCDQARYDLRQDGSIDEEIGWDISAAATWRPGFIQNFVFRLSAAALAPGDGFKDMFDNKDKDDLYYSVLFNATVSY